MFVASTVTSSTESTEKVSFDKDMYDVRRGGGGVATSNSENSGGSSSHRYLQKMKAQNERAAKDQLLSSYLNDDSVNSNVANNIIINNNTERKMTARGEATNDEKDARSKRHVKTRMGKGKTGHIDNEFESTCEIDVSVYSWVRWFKKDGGTACLLPLF
jgi:hypothetical protein